MLLLTEVLGESKSVRLAVPVQLEKVGFPRCSVWRVWSNPFAPLSTPLADSDDLTEILSKFSQMIQMVESEHASAILFQDLPMESDFFKELLKHWSNATDDPASPTAPSKKPTSRIDYIFYRPTSMFRVSHAEVIQESMASDHRPVLAVFELLIR